MVSQLVCGHLNGKAGITAVGMCCPCWMLFASHQNGYRCNARATTATHTCKSRFSGEDASIQTPPVRAAQSANLKRLHQACTFAITSTLRETRCSCGVARTGAWQLGYPGHRFPGPTTRYVRLSLQGTLRGTKAARLPMPPTCPKQAWQTSETRRCQPIS